MNLRVRMPDTATAETITIDKEVPYQLAYKIDKRNYEIRLAFYPDSKKYDKPADYFYPLVLATMLSICGSESNIIDYNAFNTNDVTMEYKAEMGLSAVVLGGSAFTEGYDIVIIHTIFKNEKGAAFIFLLYKKEDLNAVNDDFDAMLKDYEKIDSDTFFIDSYHLLTGFNKALHSVYFE